MGVRGAMPAIAAAGARSTTRTRRLATGSVVWAVVLTLGTWVSPVASAAPAMIRPDALAPPTVPTGAEDLGPVPGSQSLQLGVVLQPSNGAALQSLLQALEDPSSPDYHHWLTPGQFLVDSGRRRRRPRRWRRGSPARA